MTDGAYEPRLGRRVMAIGTAGGLTKPSTGYTFARIQRHSARVAAQLARTGQPFLPSARRSRHAWMDRGLLRVLWEGRQNGEQIFGRLFARKRVAAVLRFLGEDSHLGHDLRLMLTMNIPVFLAAGLRETFAGRPDRAVAAPARWTASRAGEDRAQPTGRKIPDLNPGRSCDAVR